MKKLALFAAVAALSACNQTTDEAPAATETETAIAEATPMADSGVGTYEVKMADGTVGTTVINADGTYVDTDKDGKEVRGTFVRRDGKDCFDPEGDDAEMCWTVTAAAADGSFTATAPDGETVVTVTRSGTAATATTAATPAPAAT